MQIVIDINENIFTRLFDNGVEDYAIINDDLFTIAKSIRNCIPLPKGHGRLIDAEFLDLENLYRENDCGFSIVYTKSEFPTIIEADEKR